MICAWKEIVLQMGHRLLLSILGSEKVFLHIQLTGCNVGNHFIKLWLGNGIFAVQKFRTCRRSSRLIPKFSVPLEHTVIAALKTEEIKDMVCNTVKELLVILDEIRRKAENDGFIKNMTMRVRLKERNKNTKCTSTFSIYDNVLLYLD